jgi:hypothetical protein
MDIIQALDDGRWLQLIYQYVIGGLFFFITIYLCFRPGAADIKNPYDRRMLMYLIVGFAGYLSVHTVWVYLAK